MTRLSNDHVDLICNQLKRNLLEPQEGYHNLKAFILRKRLIETKAMKRLMFLWKNHYIGHEKIYWMKIRGLIEAMAQSFMHRKHNSGRNIQTRDALEICVLIFHYFMWNFLLLISSKYNQEQEMVFSTCKLWLLCTKAKLWATHNNVLLLKAFVLPLHWDA